MNDTELTAAVARFLKSINPSAQRELEKAVRNAMAKGKLHGGESLTTGITLSSKELDLDITIFSKIEL